MRKSFLRSILLSVFLLSASVAWGAAPQEALSTMPEKSVYAVINLGDFGQFARYILSPANIELLTPLLDGETAGVLGMASGLVSMLPAQEVSILAGMDSELKPFLQCAIALPEALQPKLDLVASGKATPEDFAAILLGEGGAPFAEIAQALTLSGSYYTFAGDGAVTAKGNLLLIGATPADLDASLAALGDTAKRLVLNRRFASKDFISMHMDIPTMSTLAKMGGADEGGEVDFKALEAMFKKPLDMEFDFNSAPDLFRISSSVNVEAFSDVILNAIKAVKPVPGAGIFMVGSGRPILAAAGRLNIKESLAGTSPEVMAGWKEMISALAEFGISETDVDNLLSNAVSFVVGGSASVMGQKLPGVYLALNGKDGAAAKILNTIMAHEAFSASVPVAEVSVSGWQKAFKVDPALAPVSIVFGVKDEVLFLGMQEPESLNAEPEFSPKAKELLGKDLVSFLFLDVEEAWGFLGKELANPASLLSTMVIPQPFVEAAKNILAAKPSVPFMSIYAPEADKAFTDYSIQDVPQDQQILPKVIKFVAEMNKAPEQPKESKPEESEEPDESDEPEESEESEKPEKP